MKKLYLAGCLLLAAGATQAQSSPTPYPFAADIAAQQAIQPGGNQLAAWRYTAIGRDQAALAAWDQDFYTPRRPLLRFDSLAFAAYRPTDARAYILARARATRIIIINEAHHVPRHRVFTASLLPALAAQGYRYLAVEGLAGPDSLLSARGYPLRTSGAYLSEPCYGNLLRTALRAGLQVRAYDYGYPEDDPTHRLRSRELGQARNIQRILAADPQAKIIIHCGFAHLSEAATPEGDKWMAAYLKELTGLDPLTLDQTKLTEAATLAGSNRYYHPELGGQDAVLLNAQQQAFPLDRQWLRVDANVYHPPTKFVQGRPDYRFTEGRQPVAVGTQLTLPLPYQVLAYVAGEPDEAVPVDVLEVSTAADAATLALAPGRYRLVARSQSGQVQTLELKL